MFIQISIRVIDTNNKFPQVHDLTNTILLEEKSSSGTPVQAIKVTDGDRDGNPHLNLDLTVQQCRYLM